LKFLTTLLIGFFLSFCSRPESVLEQVKQAGELKVLTRNSPSTYFEGANGPAGFEYDLAQRFADSLGVQLKLQLLSRERGILSAVARGNADLAAAGITVTAQRKSRVRFGPTYQKVTEQVIYRTGTPRPKSIRNLVGLDLEIQKYSPHRVTLTELQHQHPQLVWRENAEADSQELLELVWQQLLDATVADSNEVAVNRRFFPELRVAFDIGEKRELAWAFPPDTDDSLYLEAVRFFGELRKSGELEQLLERYYGHVQRFDYVDTRKLILHSQERLPAFKTFFETAAEQYNIDWRLLAAVSYQESHWRPKARSPTGVRGLMMLTQKTARQIGVTNRLDPEASISGGAQYLARVKGKIPERIPEPDRTWFALAAYNVGFGHLEDARILTQRAGGDADRWIDLKKFLPLLSRKKWYKKTRHGFARGSEPVRYVEHVRRYFDMLVWLDRQERGEAADKSSREPTEAPSGPWSLELPFL